MTVTAEELRERILEKLELNAEEREPVIPEAWVVMGGTVLYATRPTLAEAQKVLEDERNLIEKFGPPSIEHRVIPFPKGES